MIHYEVEEAQEVVNVFAVINTHLDPDRNWLDGRMFRGKDLFVKGIMVTCMISMKKQLAR